MTTTLPGSPEAPPGLPPTAVPLPPARPSRGKRLLRGREGDPRWVRPSLIGLLAGTGLLC